MVNPETLKELLTFRREREWEQFHTPKNLSAALSVEAAELLEIFQWSRDEDLQKVISSERSAIERELADIAVILTYLSHDLGIDLDRVVRFKIDENRVKYPVELARGKATKYDRL